MLIFFETDAGAAAACKLVIDAPEGGGPELNGRAIKVWRTIGRDMNALGIMLHMQTDRLKRMDG